MAKKIKVNSNRNVIWWLIGIFLPFVGIVLYFVYKDKKKKVASSLLTSSIIGFCIYSIILLAVFNKTDDTIGEGSVSEWYQDVTSGKEIVTIIGSSGCPHCQEYKPVIKKLASKYKFNLYFFEIDNLSEEDYETLFNTYELTDFTDQIPFTFIVKDDKYINGNTGYANQDKTIEYLKEEGIIKN